MSPSATPLAQLVASFNVSLLPKETEILESMLGGAFGDGML